MLHILAQERLALPAVLHAILPPRLQEELEGYAPLFPIEELRLRRNRCASLTKGNQNHVLSTVLCDREMDELLLPLCEGSLYAHAETLCKGYLMLKGGVRVGVCGNATLREGRITGVREIGSYVIRLPSEVPPVGEEICALLRENIPPNGVLIYAPPGVGKTTLLRAVAARMSSGENPLRLCVVDTRGELSLPSERRLLVDVLQGYPRSEGISIATRSLSAQLILCDEIGDLAEAQEILHTHSCGVPLVASAHAATLQELLSRPGLALLHRAQVFGASVGIMRHPTAFDFCYRIDSWEVANALC